MAKHLSADYDWQRQGWQRRTFCMSALRCGDRQEIAREYDFSEEGQMAGKQDQTQPTGTGAAKAGTTARARVAGVTLSTGRLLDLYRGETLKIRLRNVAGEEQILELRSAMVDERTKNANVMKQYDALLAKLDALLNQPVGKGGNGSGKHGK